MLSAARKETYETKITKVYDQRRNVYPCIVV